VGIGCWREGAWGHRLSKHPMAQAGHVHNAAVVLAAFAAVIDRPSISRPAQCPLGSATRCVAQLVSKLSCLLWSLPDIKFEALKPAEKLADEEVQMGPSKAAGVGGVHLLVDRIGKHTTRFAHL
jgi:hypothetical protein